MIHWLKRLFTDKDGDADEMALLTVCAVLSYISLEIYSVIYVKDFRFEPQGFGTGLGVLIGAATAAIGFKSGQEKNP
jgi:hypothetical protein